MSAGGGGAAPVMAGIEPHSVLEQLDPLLGQTGCIKSGKEVGKIVSLMKGAQLLVVRIIILNIIKATKAHSTLDRFMIGGWSVLNVWLVEAKKTQDVAMLAEILQVLQKLPVNVAALKQGNMGKLIKQLSKQEHPEVKNFASDLLSRWMTIFKEGQAASKTKPANSAAETAENDKDKEKDNVPSAVKPQDDAPTKPEKDKKEKSFKKKEKSKGAPVLPPVEAKPPPGPLVALGRRDKPLKRPRSVETGSLLSLSLMISRAPCGSCIYTYHCCVHPVVCIVFFFYVCVCVCVCACVHVYQFCIKGGSQCARYEGKSTKVMASTRASMHFECL